MNFFFFNIVVLFNDSELSQRKMTKSVKTCEKIERLYLEKNCGAREKIVIADFKTDILL